MIKFILLFHVIFVDFEIWLKFMGFTCRKVEEIDMESN